jgi:hypothetical protein
VNDTAGAQVLYNRRMAKKNADKADKKVPSVVPDRRRVPRRAAASDAPTASAPADLSTGMTGGDERAEASDLGMPRASVTSDTPAEAAVEEPSYDDIARAAYDRYLSRGADHGRDFDDWVEAERALKQR